ncbi:MULTISPECIES: YgfZ/GcvT domain-containing protein [unclassified Acinetobacter]|uniref:CAF17-like 4Fe-4S cluster assembly/insertion protein YgfZ n=1 Tax=unclassified Acinetobacter TaxID=196816 RepID=UPI0035B980DB
MSNLMPTFQQFSYNGADAEKFLQGQVTCNVSKIGEQFLQTAICDLKGRVHFSLWLKRLSQDENGSEFAIVLPSSIADEFAAHIRKFGAFSKATLTAQGEVFAVWNDKAQPAQLEFNSENGDNSWEKAAILHGEAWIDNSTQHLFQPQELRLHQRFGVDYDKGCYLGQEIVARLWFKAQPKQWLHLIHVENTEKFPPIAQGEFLAEHVQVVNILQENQQYWALVVAKPDVLANLQTENKLTVLALPEHLQGDIARAK